MDDILSRFKRKERGSSSSDSETSPQGKRVCSQEPNETDEILVALDMSKDIGAKLQQVSLDILIGNGSLKLLWKHRMRLMLKCMQIYLRRYKKIGRSNGHG